MSLVHVALGSNLDRPRRQIAQAVEALAALPQTRLVARSHDYATPPWGLAEQPEFVNAVVALDTALDPHALLRALLAIERAQGRDRTGPRWGPRTLDLDLLLHGDRVIDDGALVLPHPRIAERAFVLLPLADIAPDLVVPGHGTVAALLARVDVTGCRRLD